jgi:hypothetical protein
MHDKLDSLVKTVFAGPWPLETRDALKALNERSGPAEELAKLAFKDKHRPAWEAVQRGLFELPINQASTGQLPFRARSSPYFRGDLLSMGLREIFWDHEDAYLERVTASERVTGKKAVEYLEAEFRRRSVFDHPLFQYFAEEPFTENQVRAAVVSYLHSVLLRLRTIHRYIASVILPMDFEDAVNMAPLVIDELGEKHPSDAHANRCAADLKRWDAEVNWTEPVKNIDMLAMLNWNQRTVTHRDALWRITGIFCIEWNSYLELRSALLAFRKRGVPDAKMDVLVQHGDGDPYDKDGHVLVVCNEMAKRLQTPEDTDLVLTGIAKHQGYYNAFTELEFVKHRQRIEAAR